MLEPYYCLGKTTSSNNRTVTVCHTLGQCVHCEMYQNGQLHPNFPVPAIAYYYSYDKQHFDLQYVMLCSDVFVDAVIEYNHGASQ